MKNFLISLSLLFLSVSPIFAKTLAKVHDLDYKKSNMFYMYSGSKATIRVSSIPYNFDMVQITAKSSPVHPKLRILGRKNIPVNSQGQGNFFEFNVELTKMPKGSFIHDSLEIEIKAFEKNGEQGEESYEILEKAHIYIRPMLCPESETPVCAMLKIPCKRYDSSCINFYEKEITFKNECEMNKLSAVYVHDGECIPENS